MKLPRAILTGTILWAIIFIEWSIIIFAPVLKDLGNSQWFIHYILLIPIVLLGASFYYKKAGLVNGFLLGLVMLITGIILDAIITVPLFTKPQGTGYAGFYLSAWAVVGYAEYLIISGAFWLKKSKA